METYDNNGMEPAVQEPVQEQPQEQTPQMAAQPQDPPQEPPVSAQPVHQPPWTSTYQGAGTGTREQINPNAYAAYHTPVQQPYTGFNHYNQYNQAYYQPPRPEKKQKKKSRGILRTCIAAVLVLVLVAGSCLATGLVTTNYWKQQNEVLRLYLNEKLTLLEQQLKDQTGSSTGTDMPISPNGMTPSQVYAMNLKSVVAISSTSIVSGGFGQEYTAQSSGSGFVLTSNGYVVTNYHVVEGATAIEVITSDSKTYTAQLKGYDATNDIAMLKVEAEDLQAATVGSSDALVVGDQVVAIGNPLGELTSTLTVGYVSAKDRDVTTDGTVINMLQTDAAINPGNSGGPLFNMKGQVVGITTAKYSGTTDSGATIEGIGFAIPIDDVIGMLEDLIQFGYITGAYLGVTVKDVDPAAMAYGVPAGAYVNSVVQGNCAAAAGVRKGDIIVELGGHDIESLNDLSRALRSFKAGQQATITVWRSGQELILTIVFDEKPHAE